MTKFENAKFDNRLKDLGDTSEGKFEEWATKHGVPFVRMGFNRPPFERFYKFPEELRLMPDYAVEGSGPAMVEVKGCGKEGLKVKLESIRVMEFWDTMIDVRIFIFNSARPQRYAWLNLFDLIALTDDKGTRKFPDGKEYYLIPNDEIEWTDWT